jgi:hypothetical protein
MPIDPYYDHEDTAKMCARFITHLFTCSDAPPTTSKSTTTPSLAHFVAYTLHRTCYHSSVTFSALYLLSRLKDRFPASHGSSGHRLYITAMIIASKVIYDRAYWNNSWYTVGQGLFTLHELNQMEREMCSYLDWHLNVAPEVLSKFEEKVRNEYASEFTAAALTPVKWPADLGTAVEPSSKLLVADFVNMDPHLPCFSTLPSPLCFNPASLSALFFCPESSRSPYSDSISHAPDCQTLLKIEVKVEVTTVVSVRGN